MRFFSPLVFTAFAAYVGWEATNGDDRVVAFPLLNQVLPETHQDPQSLGLASASLLLVFALVTGLRALRRAATSEAAE